MSVWPRAASHRPRHLFEHGVQNVVFFFLWNKVMATADRLESFANKKEWYILGMNGLILIVRAIRHIINVQHLITHHGALFPKKEEKTNLCDVGGRLCSWHIVRECFWTWRPECGFLGCFCGTKWWWHGWGKKVLSRRRHYFLRSRRVGHLVSLGRSAY